MFEFTALFCFLSCHTELLIYLQTLSLYRSEYKSATLNPVWQETAVACNVTMGHSVVLTLCDHDTLTTDDFLGQVGQSVTILLSV